MMQSLYDVKFKLHTITSCVQCPGINHICHMSDIKLIIFLKLSHLSFVSKNYSNNIPTTYLSLKKQFIGSFINAT